MLWYSVSMYVFIFHEGSFINQDTILYIFMINVYNS